VGNSPGTLDVVYVGIEDDRVLAKSNLTDRALVPAMRFRVEGTEVDHPDGGTVNTARVVMLAEEYGIDRHTIVAALSTEERIVRDEDRDWLLDLLGDGEAVRYRDIERMATAAGITGATLHRARPMAGVIMERDDGARGRPSMWRLSSQGVSSHPYRVSRVTKSSPAATRASGPNQGVSSHVSPRVGKAHADDLGAWTSDVVEADDGDGDPTTDRRRLTR
jgi:hypothetical protein